MEHVKISIGDFKRMIKAVENLGCIDNDIIDFKQFKDSLYLPEEAPLRIRFHNKSKEDMYGTWWPSEDSAEGNGPSDLRKLYRINNETTGGTLPEDYIDY